MTDRSQAQIELDLAWAEMDQQASDQKDPDLAVEMLQRYFEGIEEVRRPEFAHALARWLEGEEADKRRTAVIMIWNLRILSELPALRRLQSRLESTGGTHETPYEWSLVNRAVAGLVSEAGEAWF